MKIDSLQLGYHLIYSRSQCIDNCWIWIIQFTKYAYLILKKKISKTSNLKFGSFDLDPTIINVLTAHNPGYSNHKKS